MKESTLTIEQIILLLIMYSQDNFRDNESYTEYNFQCLMKNKILIEKDYQIHITEKGRNLITLIQTNINKALKGQSEDGN